MEIVWIKDKPYFAFTADEEEPSCGKCIYQSGDWRCDECGPSCGWYYYRRVKPIDRKNISGED
jgi:hypothetical protein